MLNPPLKTHGGKHFLADWIIQQIPAHTHYVEPYAGGLSVLLRKSYEGISEVVNDLDKELINFWRVLQSHQKFTRLCRRLEATPFSAIEYERAQNHKSRSTIDRAWNFFVLCRQSRQGLHKDFTTLTRNRVRRGMNEQASSW
jgi:DNA adenine methylase